MKQQNNMYFWYGIPAILNDTHLRSNARIVLTMVYTYLHQNKICTVSNKTFSKWTGYKPNTISSIINRFKKKGWLYIKPGWIHYPNGTKQRVRVIYGINESKLRQSTQDVVKRVGAKNVFKDASKPKCHITIQGGIPSGRGTLSRNSDSLISKNASSDHFHRNTANIDGITSSEYTVSRLSDGSMHHSNRNSKLKHKNALKNAQTVSRAEATYYNPKLKNNNILSNKPSYSNNSLRLQNRNRKNTKSKIEDKFLKSNVKLESYSNGYYKAPSTVFDTLALLFKHFKNNIEYIHTNASQIKRSISIIKQWLGDSQNVRDDALNDVVGYVFHHQSKRFYNILYLVKVIDSQYIHHYEHIYEDKERAYKEEQASIAKSQAEDTRGIRHDIVNTARNMLEDYHNGFMSKKRMFDYCKELDPEVKKIIVSKLSKQVSK